jgi:UPF0716 protein FxsA
MVRFLTLVTLAALAAAEVAAVMALVDRFGSFYTLLVLALDMLLGMVLMSRAARTPGPDRGWRVAAGAFIALPGLVLDLVGVLLLVAPVRRWAMAHLARGTESALRRRGVSVVTVTDANGTARTTVVPGDVVVGEVVPEDPETTWKHPAQPPQGTSDGAPRVIRGELTED